MDDITPQLMAGTQQMANAGNPMAGGMQQMPVGAVPGGQAFSVHPPAGPRSAPFGSGPPPFQSMPPAGSQMPAMPQMPSMQGGFGSMMQGMSQQPMFQQNPQLQQMWERFQQNPAYQGIFNAFSQMFPANNNPFGSSPGLPQVDDLMERYRSMIQQAPSPAPRFGRPGFQQNWQQPQRNWEREDSYGNPVAPPVMNDWRSRMPDLLSRYGM